MIEYQRIYPGVAIINTGGVAVVNVLMVSAEAAPFAKVGGMADVVGSLPAALRKAGVDARVLLPGYGFIPHDKYHISYLFSFQFHHRRGTSDVHLYSTVYDGVPVYFLQVWPYFGWEGAVYMDYAWDLPRFVFFNQVAMAAIWELGARLGWGVDVVHTHDWHTGLLPFLIATARADPFWRNMATLHTIHNLAYQGNWAGGFLFESGIPGRSHPHLVYQDLTDNLMAISLAYSNMLTTVSPRYVIEIQYPYQGYGLDGMIRNRVDDLRGILNGIDMELWNPATDPALVSHYDADTFRTQRAANKAHLQRSLGLPERPDVPLIGIVSRLVYQKGIDLLIPAMYRLLSEFDVQFVALGTGESQYEYELGKLGYDMGWRGARTLIGYDAGIAQHIYAGADLFAMPSHFEPCGLGQMMAMRYGALPVVRETGGLADTVQNYDNGAGDSGTGFVFNWQQPDAVYHTFRWALETYWDNKPAWERLQERAMRQDFGWDKSAAQYIELYHSILARVRSHAHG